jgi:predicted phosphodiesterase
MQKLLLFHLSDIHFNGSSGVTVHDLDSDVRNELIRDAARLTKELGSATGVLVTGDIAFSGQRAEYERAAAWLREFCLAIDCPEENVWVVPGNHDVDRKLAGSKLTKALHEGIRSKDEASIDSELREIFADQQSANALLAPLAEYNTFAARFQCSISPQKPFWERDLVLDCGTIIRLRGLCSALVSNAHDAKGNVVLGTAQASVPRIDGVEYLTLCHHPPDWLRDQDSVVSHLESKVRIQLFGHKHVQRVQTINRTLRLTAGAMHPERHERGWVPTYNIIEITRRHDERLGIRLFQRRWHETDCRFVGEYNHDNGKDHQDHIWQDCPRPAVRRDRPSTDVTRVTRRDLAVPAVVTSKATAKEDLAMPLANHERRRESRVIAEAGGGEGAVAGKCVGSG